MNSRFIITGICLVIFLVPNYGHSQNAPEVSIPATDQHELKSNVTNKKYHLFVSLPQNYSASDTTRYCVLYVLDGNNGFPLAVSMHRLMSLYGEVSELIIVGIGYPAEFYSETITPRWYDYTPTNSAATDSIYASQRGMELRSGGGAEFLQLISKQIIPFIESNYRTNKDRGLWGHSFGGLFAAYAFFEEPSLFDRYGLSSPSLWWDNGELFKREATYANNHDDLPVDIYITSGSEEKQLVPLMKKFTDVLKSRNYENISIDSKVFENENHLSVIPAALSRGMRTLYSTLSE